MKHRSPLAVAILSLVTLGIYSIVWQVKTKNEMKALGAEIPTAWLIIVPFVNYYWLWKYCQGVEKVSGGQTSAVMAFVLLFLLSIIGMAILQSEFNKLTGASPVASTGNGGYVAPAAPAVSANQPDGSFGGPVNATPAQPVNNDPNFVAPTVNSPTQPTQPVIPSQSAEVPPQNPSGPNQPQPPQPLV